MSSVICLQKYPLYSWNKHDDKFHWLVVIILFLYVQKTSGGGGQLVSFHSVSLAHCCSTLSEWYMWSHSKTKMTRCVKKGQNHLGRLTSDSWCSWKTATVLTKKDVRFKIKKNEYRISHWIKIMRCRYLMYGARWVLELLGASLCKLYNCLTTMQYTWN